MRHLTKFGFVAMAIMACMAQLTIASAQSSNVFTIAKYPVEASATNAVAAKSKAVEQGRRAAFRSLLKRLVPASSYPVIEQLAKVDPDSYIASLRVRKEENSPTQYFATLDFAFDPEAMRELFSQHSVPFLDRAAPMTSLLLVYQAPAPAATAAMRETTGSSNWRRVWQGLDLKNSISPVQLVSSTGQLPPTTLDALVQAEPQTLADIAGQHKTSQLVIALAKPLPQSGELQVTLAGQDAVARFSVTTKYRLDDEDFTYSLELAAVIAQGVLEGRWKSSQLGDTAAGGTANSAAPFTILAEFGNLGQWQRQQQALAQTPGVANLEIGSLSGRSASVSLSYPGGGEALQSALGQRGIILENINGFWVMR